MAELKITCSICGEVVSDVFLPHEPTQDELNFYTTTSTCSVDGNNGTNITITVTG